MVCIQGHSELRA